MSDETPDRRSFQEIPRMHPEVATVPANGHPSLSGAGGSHRHELQVEDEDPVRRAYVDIEMHLAQFRTAFNRALTPEIRRDLGLKPDVQMSNDFAFEKLLPRVLKMSGPRATAFLENVQRRMDAPSITEPSGARM